MNTRISKLLASEDLGAAGTKVIDIDTSDPISRISIAFSTTKSKHGMDAAAPANITKIELVDGSTPLHSLTGYENQALAILSRPTPTMSHGQHLASCSEYDLYAIDFGRYLYDPELAFLPSKFANPQLKITWDEDVADTGVTANSLEIWADLFDEKKVNPVGFLAAIEQWTDTMGAANSYENIDLPTDYPIRQMLLRAFRDGYEPWYQVNEARLDEDTLKRIPFEWDSLENMHRLQKGMMPPIQETCQGVCNTGGTNIFYATPTDYYCTMIPSSVGGGYIAMGDTWEKGGKFGPISGSGDQFFSAIVHGWLPFHCFHFPLGNQYDIADWYGATRAKKPRLRLRSSTSGTSGTAQLVIEQLRRY
jgi:hypothetical protein